MPSIIFAAAAAGVGLGCQAPPHRPPLQTSPESAAHASKDHAPPALRFEGYDRRMLLGEGWLFRRARFTLTNASTHEIWLPAALWEVHRPVPPDRDPPGAQARPLRALAPGQSVRFRRWLLEGKPARLTTWYAHHLGEDLRTLQSPVLTP